MLTRDLLLARLRPALERPEVRAAWLGGSDATGRTDALSDLDVVVIVDDGAVAEVLHALEEAAGRPRGRLLIPPEKALGHAQVLLQVADAPPWLQLDLVVIARSSPPDTWYLEPERHGTPCVLIDRDGLLTHLPRLDRPSHEARIDRRLAELADAAEVFPALLEKAIARGHLAEAADRHVRFVVAPLIEVLRMRHAPDRFDFGPRYLDRDLPPDDRRFVERLCCWGDLDTLRRRSLEGTARLQEELRTVRDRRAAKPQSIVQNDPPSTRS